MLYYYLLLDLNDSDLMTAVLPICAAHTVLVVLFWSLILSVSQLSEARDETLEGLNRTVDYKVLKGKDPSTVELVKKIEQVHNNVTRCLCVRLCVQTLHISMHLQSSPVHDIYLMNLGNTLFMFLL